MKFKIQSSKFKNGWRKRVDLSRVLRTSNFDLRSSRQRRGSVLVLVMTILGILFVLGIAFLASMNFEADMISSESQHARVESSVTAVVDQLGATLRDGLMSGSRIPFGDPTSALSATAFAEMPGVHNSFSSVEPSWYPGPDGVLDAPLGNGGNDMLVFSAYADVPGLRQRPYAGLSQPRHFAIMTALPNGADNKQCLDGDDKGLLCPPSVCPGSVCEGPRVVDADGDGVVDSMMVDASLLDFSDAQVSALSVQLNPASNPTGKVFVGLRVLPHGGLVNLNASHPKLIENVLDVRLPSDPASGKFKHRPTLQLVAYSPLLEEPSLRRRGFLAPRTLPPSWLHGDALLPPPPGTDPPGLGDMSWQLFNHVYHGAMGEYESVYPEFPVKRRYWAFNINWVPSDPYEVWESADYSVWAARMEPFVCETADLDENDGILTEYDRRHLVTTVSHDDLLARGGRVPNPAVPGGEEDILAKMIQANQAAFLPPGEGCPVILPFEYPDYPATIPDDCCPTDPGCKLNARKGRLQLSLSYLDDRIVEARSMPDSTDVEKFEKNNAFESVYRLIYDTFFLLVRNAAHLTTLEGTRCDPTSDPMVSCPFAGGECSVADPLNPICVHSTHRGFTKCTSDTDCRIPGSVCRADGKCTIQAPFWQDRPCTGATDCAAGEFCDPIKLVCLDSWTHQTHSQALVTRTAAALTANFIDFADADDVPTRVALRSMDFTPGTCVNPGPNQGLACEINDHCGAPGIGDCSPPQRLCMTLKFRTPLDQAAGGLKGKFPIAPMKKCVSDIDCPAGTRCALGTSQFAGREFDLDTDANILRPKYVYGLERQPYVTEVATLAVDLSPVALTARGIELFNPYSFPLDLNGYYIVEVDGTGAKPAIDLSGNTLSPDSFTVFASGDTPPYVQQLTDPTTAQTLPVALQFEKDWTIYLVRRVNYPDSPNIDIVVDQFHVTGNCVGVGAPTNAYDPGTCGVPPQRHSAERVVGSDATRWTASIALDPAVEQIGAVSLGTWNNALNNALHPVEVNFADLDNFTNNPVDPIHGTVSFPTTGSMLMLMRHANRSIRDYTPPPPSVNPVKELAFTTRLVGDTVIKDPVSGLPLATISAEMQIDNGRMPVFDEPAPTRCVGGTSDGNPCTEHCVGGADVGNWCTTDSGCTGTCIIDAPGCPGGGVCGTDDKWYSAHHLSPSVTPPGTPGDLGMIPWGQLVFDYFTALPLSNDGPYFTANPAAPDSQPRVDLDGLRVHGRININAAPWKVLGGLPFTPMEKIPSPFRNRIRSNLPGFPGDPSNPRESYTDKYDDNEAGPIGNPLAQAIVAYRDLHPIPPHHLGPGAIFTDGPGNYATGSAADGTPTPFARGWDIPNTAYPISPIVRRGTGFMTVGELANVRHFGSELLLDSSGNPIDLPDFPTSYFRIDAGVIDLDQTDNNTEDYIAAVATLVALGDWVSVRSHVSTVYGILRGEEDSTIVVDPPDPLLQQKLRTRDADSRALRFQETIDRLPTFLGEPTPSRIGDRTFTRYSDVLND